jgi:hypothetical protein
MSADTWEDLREEICTKLLIGKENGEAELEAMARMVWLERQKYLTSEQLREAAEAALEAAVAALEAIAVTSPVEQQLGVDLPKGKVLRWKTLSRSVGASAFAASFGVPPGVD